MNKFKVIVWMTVMIAFFHLLSWDFGKQGLSKAKLYPRENDHVKKTELLLVDDLPGDAAEQQVLVPARRFVKHYRRPGEYMSLPLLKRPEIANERD